MATEAPEKPAVERSAKRIRPHQIVIGLGVAIGAFTAASGIVPLLTKWNDKSSVQREVFGGIPGLAIDGAV